MRVGCGGEGGVWVRVVCGERVVCGGEGGEWVRVV